MIINTGSRNWQKIGTHQHNYQYWEQELTDDWNTPTQLSILGAGTDRRLEHTNTIINTESWNWQTIVIHLHNYQHWEQELTDDWNTPTQLSISIFNLSFQSGVVPDIWKTSCIVPVPKNNKVGSMNDLRPVALTSVAFKTCERIVLPQLKSFIHDSLDPFQFAYQSNRSCEDALLVTINEVTSHLDSKLSVKKKQS